MKICELYEDIFGVPTPSPEQVAEKHGVDLEVILAQLAKGTEVEQEHTKNQAMAREIALDHLNEMPDYYTRLDKMERGH
jgi:uncharacterized DUF497 family protein